MKTYLNELKNNLSELGETEVQEILRDQEEYIQDALSGGRNLEDILKALGSPKELAKNILAQNKIQSAMQSTNLKDMGVRTWKAMLSVLILAPFNFFFIFIPFMIIMSILLGFWAATIACNFAFLISLPVIFILIFKGFISFGIFISILFAVLGLIGLGILSIAFMTLISKNFIKATLKYLHWNTQLI